MSEVEKITLANLGRGAAGEKFDQEMKRILANLVDPNTPATAREITLKVRITPDENRKAAGVEIICSSKPAAPKGFKTQFFIGRGADGLTAVEYNPDQMKLFGDEAPAMRAVEGGKK